MRKKFEEADKKLLEESYDLRTLMHQRENLQSTLNNHDEDMNNNLAMPFS